MGKQGDYSFVNYLYLTYSLPAVQPNEDYNAKIGGNKDSVTTERTQTETLSGCTRRQNHPHSAAVVEEQQAHLLLLFVNDNTSNNVQ